MATGQPSPDASESGQSAINVGTPADAAPEVSQSDDRGPSDDSGACSLPGPTCCVAAGGLCVIGSFPCAGQVSTVSCGEFLGGGFYCCLPLNPGPPIEAGITLLGGPDGAPSPAEQEGGTAEQEAGTCVAAGGECAPCTDPQFDLANNGGTSCMLSRPCAAIGFQNCGLGTACCLNVCDPNARSFEPRTTTRRARSTRTARPSARAAPATRVTSPAPALR